MFTWICPQCRREVPPSYTECPDCAAKARGAGTAPPPPPAEPAPIPSQTVPPPEPPRMPPQPSAAPPAPPQQQPYAAPPAPSAYDRPLARPRPAAAGLPTWLLAVLFSLAFLGVGSGIYWLVGALHGNSQAAPAAAVESPAAKPGAKTNPYQKYIEVSGIRIAEDPKHKDQVLVRFMVTNHAEADISGLAGNVTLWGRTAKSEEDAAGTFSFRTDLKALESKDVTAPLVTKLKIYELPDWQNATPDLQVTAPGGASEGSPASQ